MEWGVNVWKVLELRMSIYFSVAEFWNFYRKIFAAQYQCNLINCKNAAWKLDKNTKQFTVQYTCKIYLLKFNITDYNSVHFIMRTYYISALWLSLALKSISKHAQEIKYFQDKTACFASSRLDYQLIEQLLVCSNFLFVLFSFSERIEFSRAFFVRNNYKKSVASWSGF